MRAQHTHRAIEPSSMLYSRRSKGQLPCKTHAFFRGQVKLRYAFFTASSHLPKEFQTSGAPRNTHFYTNIHYKHRGIFEHARRLKKYWRSKYYSRWMAMEKRRRWEKSKRCEKKQIHSRCPTDSWIKPQNPRMENEREREEEWEIGRKKRKMHANCSRFTMKMYTKILLYNTWVNVLAHLQILEWASSRALCGVRSASTLVMPTHWAHEAMSAWRECEWTQASDES